MSLPNLSSQPVPSNLSLRRKQPPLSISTEQIRKHTPLEAHHRPLEAHHRPILDSELQVQADDKHQPETEHQTSVNRMDSPTLGAEEKRIVLKVGKSRNADLKDHEVGQGIEVSALDQQHKMDSSTSQVEDNRRIIQVDISDEDIYERIEKIKRTVALNIEKRRKEELLQKQEQQERDQLTSTSTTNVPGPSTFKPLPPVKDDSAPIAADPSPIEPLKTSFSKLTTTPTTSPASPTPPAPTTPHFPRARQFTKPRTPSPPPSPPTWANDKAYETERLQLLEALRSNLKQQVAVEAEYPGAAERVEDKGFWKVGLGMGGWGREEGGRLKSVEEQRKFVEEQLKKGGKGEKD